MSAYLVDESVLRQVLDELVIRRDAWYTTSASIPPQLKNSIEALRTILSNPPKEPVAWGVLWKDKSIRSLYRTKGGAVCDLHHAEMSGCAVDKEIPLYTKDTP